MTLAGLYDPTVSPPTLTLIDVPILPLEPGELRIDVRAVPVSPFWLSLGTAPFVPCWIFAGVVSEVGAEIDGGLIGRRVVAMHRTGGLAESVVVPLAAVHGLPDSVGFPESACAAAGVKASLIAEDLVDRFHGLGRRARVAVTHDGTYFASVLTGLLRRAGVETIGVSRAPCTVAYQATIGFEPAVDLADDDFVAAVLRVTGDEGVDCIVDHLGALTLEDALEVVRPGGVLLRCDPLRRVLAKPSAATLRRWSDLGAEIVEFEGVMAAARRIDDLPAQVTDVLGAVAVGDIVLKMTSIPFAEVHRVPALLRSESIAGPVVVTR